MLNYFIEVFAIFVINVKPKAMEATVSQITKKLKSAPQEVLETILHYLNTLDKSQSQEIPGWQKKLIDQRLNDLDNPELIHPIDELYTYLDAD